jgi:hypothetical protein
MNIIPYDAPHKIALRESEISRVESLDLHESKRMKERELIDLLGIMEKTRCYYHFQTPSYYSPKRSK